MAPQLIDQELRVEPATILLTSKTPLNHQPSSSAQYSKMDKLLSSNKQYVATMMTKQILQ
jgi:hypothetical protein